MSKLRKCSQCGETVYNTVDHTYCMYCGESLSDSCVLNEETIESFSPCKKQYFAAALLVVYSILTKLFSLGIIAMLFSEIFLNASTLAIIQYSQIANMSLNILFVLAMILLCKSASNKASRVATYVMMGTVVFYLISLGLTLLEVNNPVISVIFGLLPNVLTIYAYGLVMQNNYLNWTNRVWINLLPIISCYYLALVFSGIPTIDVVHHNIYEILYSSSMYMIWMFIIFILEVVALIKFACCEAFSGKYDTHCVGNYMPFNKYIAAMLVTPSVIMLVIFLFLKYGAQFIEF